MDFVNWLNEELGKRDWSIRELARRSGISHASISQVLNRHRYPGSDFCLAIARGLQLPPEEVFRRAGILPPRAGETERPSLRQIWELLKGMDEAQLAEVRRYARYVASTDEDDASGGTRARPRSRNIRPSESEG
jgi:transcriptional regulator with XRE-family HTH domain